MATCCMLLQSVVSSPKPLCSRFAKSWLSPLSAISMARAVSASRASGFQSLVQQLQSQKLGMAKNGGFKRSGVAFAILCCATTGIVPLLGIGVMLLQDESAAIPMAPPAPAPVKVDVSGLSSYSREVPDALNSMAWKRLQRLEEAFASELPGRQAAAMEAAEQARESERKAWAAAKAAENAAQRVGSEGVPSSATVPDFGDLGVDYAAWKAGAEIDHSHTTSGLHRGFWSRVVRVVTSLVPGWRMLAATSHPPEVVLTWETGPPSRCFALNGQSAKISILFWQPLRPSHMALEQSPSWAMDPRTSPKNFEVYVWPTGMDDAYSLKLGNFEFLGGSQIFNLTSEAMGTTGPMGLVRGLQVRIQSNWGEEHTSICRLRVFGNRSA